MGDSIYASYTYEHPSLFVRYPHLRRLRLLERIIGSARFGSWLDYGAGDAAIVSHMHRSGRLGEARIVLYEPWAEIRSQIRIGNGLDISVVGELGEIPERPFDLVTALEVLEHLPLPERIRFYRLLARQLAPGGRCLIEVPVEYGPILLLKEYGRRVLKGRRSDYRPGELMKAGFLGIVEDSHGRFDPEDGRQTIIPHQGFDTACFLEELSTIGEVVRIWASPFPYLPRSLNQCILIDYRLAERDADAAERRIRAFVKTRAARRRTPPRPGMPPSA